MNDATEATGTHYVQTAELLHRLLRRDLYKHMAFTFPRVTDDNFLCAFDLEEPSLDASVRLSALTRSQAQRCFGNA